MADQPTFVAVLVTGVYRSPLLRHVKACGTTFRYETHLATTEGTALLVSCLCPRGHGVAGRQWHGWLATRDGCFDLVDAALLSDIDGLGPDSKPAEEEG